MFQCEEQLKRGHCAGITLHHPYPPAYMVVLKVDEQRAPPQSAGLVLGHPKHISGYTRQQVGGQEHLATRQLGRFCSPQFIFQSPGKGLTCPVLLLTVIRPAVNIPTCNQSNRPIVTLNRKAGALSLASNIFENHLGQVTGSTDNSLEFFCSRSRHTPGRCHFQFCGIHARVTESGDNHPVHRP